jgi:hypothetical protein
MEFTAKKNDGLCMPCAKGFKCKCCGKLTLSGMGGLCSACYKASPPLPKPKRTSFNHDLMLGASLTAIESFAKEHIAETFYAFAIDADMLCLNSLQEFEKTLQQYALKWPEYMSDNQERDHLYMNTGDWAYQGFYTLQDECGFCNDAYNDHYDQAAMDEVVAQSSEYALAMDCLLKAIEESDILCLLNRTENFRLFRAEHEY